MRLATGMRRGCLPGSAAAPRPPRCQALPASARAGARRRCADVAAPRRGPALLAATAGDSSGAPAAAVSDDEAERFEKIAAALLEKLKDLPDDELEPADAFADEDLLLDFGSAVSPQQAAELQARLEERRAAAGAATSSSSSSASRGGGDASAFVPRKLRRSQVPIEALPKVAVVGRPNVGKSALFNRLAGSSLAVVYDYPGVTRDRLYTRAFWGDKEYCLIDTGGLMSDAARLPAEQQEAAMASISADGLPQAIERQAAAGVAEADSIVLVVDGQAGLHPSDEEVLTWLRQNHPAKPVVLAVNKCESVTKGEMQAAEFWELGLQPHPVSAISGTGTGEMLDVLVATLPPPTAMAAEDPVTDKPLAIAIVGRPNVGKSSMLNAICGEERAIVCDLSGTTRDAVDTTITLPDGTKLTLIDTAGIRKRARVADSKDGAEQLSVDRALRALSRAEVAVIVLDGAEGVTQQDYRLSEQVSKAGCACVIAVNKWDRVSEKEAEDMDAYKADVKAQLREVGWAPVICTTASKGRRVDEVVAAILAAGQQHRRRVSTATLNLVLREAVAWKAPPSQRGNGRQGRIYYTTQAGSSPPSFVMFVNDPRLFSDDYRRYLERNLRQNLGFEGSPIRLYLRARRSAEKPDGGGGGGSNSSSSSAPSFAESARSSSSSRDKGGGRGGGSSSGGGRGGAGRGGRGGGGSGGRGGGGGRGSRR